MENFDTSDLIILGGGTFAAILFLYLVGDWSLTGAIGWPLGLAIVALIALYFRGKRSS